MQPLKDKILEIAKETIETLEYKAIELKLLIGKSTRVLKVVLYKAGGVSMDDCSTVSNVLLRRLELEIQGFSENYDLVVESPGVDRKIANLEEIQLFSDRDLRLVLRNSGKYGQKDNVMIGKVAGVEGESIKFLTESGEKLIAWDDIASAKLYFDIKKYL